MLPWQKDGAGQHLKQETGGGLDANLRAKCRAEIPGIYTPLLAMAVDLIRRSGWRRRFDMERKGAAEDLLHEAILRVWSANRIWDPAKVDLWGFLVGAMKSLVYDAAQSPENRTSSLDEPIGDGGGRKADLLEQDSETLEEAYVREEEAKGIEDAILAAAGDDPVLLKYVEAIMDGAGSPAEIAGRTGMPASAVYQAHRKLCRRVEAQKAPEESHDETKN